MFPSRTPSAHRADHNRPGGGVHLTWRVRRKRLTFRCAVVQPAAYAPERHGPLFAAEISRLLEVAPYNPAGPQGAAEPLDLLTWPEAFLCAGDLVDVLSALKLAGGSPCVHVGLRPDELTSERHLFTHGELERLTDRLLTLSPAIASDLKAFRNWLSAAPTWGHYNVACVFVVDTRGELRVCLHPKNTAAPIEVSPLPEGTVCEADFAALITLEADDRSIIDVHLQPLICSDLLELRRRIPGPGPIAAVNTDPERIGPSIPDSIDIVSVTTCTLQANEAVGRRPTSLAWQPKFRDAFLAPLQRGNLLRHVCALVILSNYAVVSDAPAGLSGCYVPKPLPEGSRFQDFARVWTWGRSNSDRHWSLMDGAGGEPGWRNDAHLITLEPGQDAGRGGHTALAFTIDVFPRHQVPQVRATLANLAVVQVGAGEDGSVSAGGDR